MGRVNSVSTNLAVNVFELSQVLKQKWVRANIAQKRELLDILCLNLTLDAVTLVPTMRKPFDVIAEGLVSTETRGDWICTFVNETPGLGLVRSLFPQVIEFTGVMILQYVQPGLYSKRK